MYQQKQKELLKQFEKQEKKLRDLKAGGKSTKQAVSEGGGSLSDPLPAPPLDHRLPPASLISIVSIPRSSSRGPPSLQGSLRFTTGIPTGGGIHCGDLEGSGGWIGDRGG